MTEDRLHPAFTLVLVFGCCLLIWALAWTVIYALTPGPASEACHAGPTIERSNAPHV